MKKQTETKLFAFKLAEKTQEANSKSKTKWTARKGVAVAGCTGWRGERYGETGMYC